MMDAMTTLLGFIAFVVAGLLGSLLGLGGGIIVIPTLTLLLGVDMHRAVGAGIVAVIATSIAAASTYTRESLANIRIATFLEVATTSGAVAGALLAAHIPGRALSFVFGCLMVYSIYSVARGGRNDADRPPVEPHPLATRLGLHGTYHDHQRGERVAYNVTGVGQGFGVMWLAGLMSGLLGIGSGALKVAGLDLAMRLPLKVSTATSNLMIGVTAASSAWYYYAHGLLEPELDGPVALGVLIGARLGTVVMARLPALWLRRLLLPVLAYVAVTMLYRGVVGK